MEAETPEQNAICPHLGVAASGSQTVRPGTSRLRVIATNCGTKSHLALGSFTEDPTWAKRNHAGCAVDVLARVEAHQAMING